MAGNSVRGDGAVGGESSARAGDAAADRQVLVVGGGPTAVTAAGFLDRAGLDPVLAGSASERMPAEVITLWRPGLVVLDRLGLRHPIERRGTRLDRLCRPATGSAWATDPSDRPVLLSLRRDELAELLEQRVRTHVRTVDGSVTGVDPTDAGVVATFDRGVRESFDAVVTADPTVAPASTFHTEATAVHAWAFEWRAAERPPSDAVEAWDGDRAAFVTPVGDGAYVHLVSVDRPTPAVDADALERRFGDLLEPLGDPFGALDGRALRYRRSPRVVPESMCGGGVALAGPAGHASLPGDCLGPTLALEDAWVVADTLAYGPSNRNDALDVYDARRRRRKRELRRHATADVDPDRVSTLLGRLYRARTLAFGHVTGRFPAVARAPPESL
ncbi:hypothetical protein [Haloplanus salilacus]|uniref:hypothetical protein n=1 Tax=Haloplanus salilacus TaxID=2949994 RepID=UPI0030D485F3